MELRREGEGGGNRKRRELPREGGEGGIEGGITEGGIH